MRERLESLGRVALGSAYTRRGAQLLALFLVLRMGFVGITLVSPDGGVLVDSRGYLALRNRIVNTGRYSNPGGSAQDLNWPPGYPAFLSLTRVIFGSGLWPVTIVQLAISGVLALALLRLGESTIGMRAGLLGAWVVALSPNAIVWSLAIMSEVLFAAVLILATVSLVLWKKPLWTRALASGALLGAAAYVRPIALLLLPAWMICVAWFAWRTESGRRALLVSLALLLAGSAVTAPWYVRNYLVHGEATFSTVGEKTLVGFNLAEVLADAEGISRNQAVAEIGEDQPAFQLALSLFRDYPVSFLKTQTFGIVRTALGIDIGAWGNVFGWDDWTGLGLMTTLFGREALPVEGRQASTWETALRYGVWIASLAHTMLFIGLAGLGLIAWTGKRTPLYFWLPLLTIVLFLVIPGASGQARFRVPAEPFLGLFAGVGGVRLLDALKLGSFRGPKGEERAEGALGEQVV